MYAIIPNVAIVWLLSLFLCAAILSGRCSTPEMWVINVKKQREILWLDEVWWKSLTVCMAGVGWKIPSDLLVRLVGSNKSDRVYWALRCTYIKWCTPRLRCTAGRLHSTRRTRRHRTQALGCCTHASFSSCRPGTSDCNLQSRSTPTTHRRLFNCNRVRLLFM